VWSVDISEEHIATNFKVKEYTKQENSVKVGDKQSILKLEVTCSYETSVNFERGTWRYIPEYRTL
jgi:hypothetical protein